MVLVDKNFLLTISRKIGCLDDLSLIESGIGGQLPTEIGKLTNLKRVVLGGEELQGTLPSEIGLWTNIGMLGVVLRNHSFRQSVQHVNHLKLSPVYSSLKKPSY